MTKTAVILPPREYFEETRAGAIALFVKETSTPQSNLVVFGPVVEKSFENIEFQSVEPKGYFFERQGLKYVKGIVAHLETKKVRVIEIHNRPHYVSWFQKKLSYQPHYSVFFHNDPLAMEGIKRPKDRQKLAQSCSALYFVSDFIKERFLKDCFFDDALLKKCHVIPNGIELDRFKNDTLKKEKSILFVGRMVEEKGVLCALEALQNILPKYPDWNALFIGSVKHGRKNKPTDLEKKLTDFTAHFPNFSWQPFSPYGQIVDAFKASSIALTPSIWLEPFGRTAVEAMAASCALVATTQGGLSSIVKECAIIVAPDNTQDLLQAIEQLINDRQLLKDTQRKCFEEAMRFDLRLVEKRLNSLRQEVSKDL